MPTLAIDKGFLKDLGKLEKPVYNRVTEVFDEFDAATHTGLHLEKIANARNPRFRSIRIDQAWRGIVLAPVTGDVYSLLKVLHHDDAYAWAQRSSAATSRSACATRRSTCRRHRPNIQVCWSRSGFRPILSCGG